MTTDYHTDATTEAETMSGRENLKETGREAVSATKERLDEVRAEARSALGEAGDAVKRQTEAAKGQAASEIRHTAEGLEAAAHELEDRPFQRDLLHEAAEGLKQISCAVDGKSLSQMTAELSDFARQNPLAYLGGAALAGFALARFARATDPGEAADPRAGAARYPYSPASPSTQPASPGSTTMAPDPATVTSRGMTGAPVNPAVDPAVDPARAPGTSGG